MIVSIRYIFMALISVFCTAGVFFTETPESTAAKKFAVPDVEDLLIDRFVSYYSKVFQKGFEGSHCPGAAIAIVKDSNVILLDGFGLRKSGLGEEVDPNTMFRIGSLSKGLTGVLCAILVEKGILHWEDKVIDILPDFELKDMEQAGRITIAHLLSHSSGLPRHTFTDLIEDGLSIGEIRSRLDEVNLLGEEGKLFAYQNHAYSIIEDIIQQKTGKSYCELLEEYLLIPNGMTDVSCTYDDLMICDNKSAPHRNTKKGYCCVPYNTKYYNAVSCGGINASAADMAEYLKLLLGNRPEVIGDSALSQVFTPFIKIQDNDYYHKWLGVKSVGYGMGWRILNKGDYQVEYHAGSVNDYRSEIAVDHKNKIAICVLFNAQNNYARNVVPDFLNTYAAYKACVKGR